MSLFGAKPATGGSLFGQPQQQQQTGGGLFGGAASNTNNNTGGGLFGQNNQQQQQQGQTGGLFGQQNNNNQANSGGGLFGSKPAGSGLSLNIGAANAGTSGGGLFGQNNQQQQQQQTGQTGGLFGQQQNQGQQQQTGGLFGQSTAQNNTGGGLFGQSTAQNNNTGGTGFFGQQPAQNNMGGGIFGQQANNTGGTGLFGQSTAQNNNTGGTGLFGQSTAQPSTGLFGQNTTQQQQPASGGLGLFGKPQQQTSLFSGSVNTQQATQQWGQQLQQSNMQNQSVQQSKASNSTVPNDLAKIYNKWNPEHPECEFKFYFYNQVGADKASLYQKPPADDQRAWDKAYAERPNPGSIPVLAYGFKDLQERVRIQESQIQIYRRVLHEIQDMLNRIAQRHDLANSLKLEECKKRHEGLARRSLALAAKVQVLRNRGYALQPDEEMLKKRLEKLLKEVQDPGVWGRLNEIWARMTVVREKAKQMQEEIGNVGVEWDETQLKTTQKLLVNNSKGLQVLANEVKEIEKAFNAWEAEHKR
ncbi:hypothetical protein BJ508DRAFT_414911 [Ascobolus immersus RN42]|uniref:Nucleoporin Nup54 alpha-helical domain-containing protein n=1 Tax=Ascobolus immersus RN42 TaxID=1160509 RepID=A0A3N4I599_ASCIM|nr:hypothetical protein BJ508DRAFT_414911 [Ascobolus immersus RN42]